MNEAEEVIWVPSSDFSAELYAFLVWRGTDEIDGEVADNGHVFSAMSFSDAREIVSECDIEHPMQRVLDQPMGAHGLAKPLRGRGARGNIKAPLGSCAGLGLDLAFDYCDGGEFGKAVFAWKVAFALHPIDSCTYEAAALLNAAMPLIHIGVAIHGGFVRIVEKAFHSDKRLGWLAFTARR